MAALGHQKFRSNLEELGFTFDLHGPCTANHEVKDKQQTMQFHVDDIVSSNVDKKGNDEFLMWSNEKHREHAEATATRVKEHKHLGMRLNFNNGNFEVDMTEYTKQHWENFL